MTTRMISIPVPLVAPLGFEVNSDMIQDVWDTFVRPDQDKELPQSGEMRVLMAILRAAYVGLLDDETKEKK